MGKISIEIEGGIGAGGGGAGLLKSIEETLRRIEGIIDRQNRQVEKSLQLDQRVEAEQKKIEQTLNRQRETAEKTINIDNRRVTIINQTNNLLNQQFNQATQINQQFVAVERSIERAQRETRGWGRELSALARTVQGVSRGLSAQNASFSGVAPFSGLGRIGRESFAGTFSGEGLGGIVGGIARVPFGVAEAGLKLGGSLASSVATGFTRTIGALGGGLSSTLLGSIVGIPLQIGGAAAGIAGSLAGGALDAAGGLLGEVGKLGGKIAETLVNGAVKGLTVGGAAVGGLAVASIATAIDQENVRGPFNSNTAAFGGGDAVLGGLRSSTRGTVSDFQLMVNANRALQLGAAQSAEDLDFLAEAARRLGRAVGIDTTEAYQRLTVGIGKMSAEMLDELGIQIRAGDAYKAYASILGKTREELTQQERTIAFASVAYDALAQKVQALGDDTLTTGDRWDQFKTNLANTSATIGTALLPMTGRLLEALNPLVDRVEKWVEANEDLIAEKTLAGVGTLVKWFEKGKEAVERFLERVENNGIQQAITDTLAETEKLWEPWVKFAKGKFDELFNHAEQRLTRFALEVQATLADEVEQGLSKFVFGDDGRFFGIAVSRRAKEEDEAAERAEKKWRKKFPYDSGIRSRYGLAYHGGLGDPDGPMGSFPALNYMRGLDSAGAPMSAPPDESPTSRPSGRPDLGPDAVYLANFKEAIGDLTRELDRRTEKLIESLERKEEKIRTLLERSGEIDDRVIDTKLKFSAALAELGAEFARARADIADRKAERLAAAPGNILRGYREAIDEPGISLHARAALLRPERLERRERAREINATFGSKGFGDTFPLAESNPVGAGLFGTGFGRAQTADAIGGLTGSGGAAEARAQLVSLVQASTAYIAQVAQIEKESAAELKRVKTEENAAIVELETQRAKDMRELTKLIADNVTAVRKAIEDRAIDKQEIESIKRQLAQVERLALRK